MLLKLFNGVFFLIKYAATLFHCFEQASIKKYKNNIGKLYTPGIKIWFPGTLSILINKSLKDTEIHRKNSKYHLIAVTVNKSNVITCPVIGLVKVTLRYFF